MSATGHSAVPYLPHQQAMIPHAENVQGQQLGDSLWQATAGANPLVRDEATCLATIYPTSAVAPCHRGWSLLFRSPSRLTC